MGRLSPGHILGGARVGRRRPRRVRRRWALQDDRPPGGEIFGLEPAAYVGRLRDEVLAAFAQACEEPDALLEVVAPKTALAGPGSVVEVDVRRPRPRTVLCKAVRVQRAGRPPGWLILFTDVTRERAAERQGKQLQARIVELTAYDALTGLLNLRRFREEMSANTVGARARGTATPSCVSMSTAWAPSTTSSAGRSGTNPRAHRGAPQELPSRIRCPRPPRGRRVRRAPARRRRARGPGGRQADVPDPDGRRALLDASRHVTVSMGCALWVPPSGESATDIISARARPSARRNRGASASSTSTRRRPFWGDRGYRARYSSYVPL